MAAEKTPKKIPNHLKSLHERDQEKRLVVILEKASLETVKVLCHSFQNQPRGLLIIFKILIIAH